MSEKFLKGGKKNSFYIQKFQIEISQVVFSALVFLAIAPYGFGTLCFGLLKMMGEKDDEKAWVQWYNNDVFRYASYHELANTKSGLPSLVGINRAKTDMAID